MQADLRKFENVSTDLLLLELLAGDSKNFKSLFPEISQIIGTGTSASERNKATDGQMEEEEQQDFT